MATKTRSSPLLVLLPFLFAGPCLQAQLPNRTADSLRQLLHKGPEDTGCVSLLNRLATAYVQTNLDSVIYFAGAARELATRLNYPSGLAAAFRNHCIYYQNRGDYATALPFGLQSLQLYEKEGMKSAAG